MPLCDTTFSPDVTSEGRRRRCIGRKLQILIGSDPDFRRWEQQRLHERDRYHSDLTGTCRSDFSEQDEITGRHNDLRTADFLTKERLPVGERILGPISITQMLICPTNSQVQPFVCAGERHTDTCLHATTAL